MWAYDVYVQLVGAGWERREALRLARLAVSEGWLLDSEQRGEDEADARAEREMAGWDHV